MQFSRRRAMTHAGPEVKIELTTSVSFDFQHKKQQ